MKALRELKESNVPHFPQPWKSFNFASSFNFKGTARREQGGASREEGGGKREGVGHRGRSAWERSSVLSLAQLPGRTRCGARSPVSSSGPRATRRRPAPCAPRRSPGGAGASGSGRCRRTRRRSSAAWTGECCASRRRMSWASAALPCVRRRAGSCTAPCRLCAVGGPSEGCVGAGGPLRAPCWWQPLRGRMAERIKYPNVAEILCSSCPSARSWPSASCTAPGLPGFDSSPRFGGHVATLDGRAAGGRPDFGAIVVLVAPCAGRPEDAGGLGGEVSCRSAGGQAFRMSCVAPECTNVCERRGEAHGFRSKDAHGTDVSTIACQFLLKPPWGGVAAALLGPLCCLFAQPARNLFVGHVLDTLASARFPGLCQFPCIAKAVAEKLLATYSRELPTTIPASSEVAH